MDSAFTQFGSSSRGIVHGSSSSNSNGNGNSHGNGSGSGSRRSACDRCRAHKLRCVRPAGFDFLSGEAGGGLPACERCVKAGTECLHTVRTRQASMRSSSGYERRGSTGSVSPPMACQRPVDDDVPPGPGAHLYRGNSPRSLFHSSSNNNNNNSNNSNNSSSSSNTMPSSQHPGDGQQDTGRPVQHGRPQLARKQDDFHQLMGFNAPAGTLSAMCAEFPSMMSAGIGAGVKARSMSSFELGDDDHHDHVLPTPRSAVGHWPESDLGLTSMFGQAAASDDAAGPSKPPPPPPPPLAMEQPSGRHHPKSPRRPTSTYRRCETKDECLRQLTELTARLLDCFSRTEDQAVELEDILAYAPCSHGRGDDDDHHPDHGSEKNVIGVLLESSQVFLDTLESLRSLQAQRQDRDRQRSCSPPTSTASEYSYVDTPDAMDVFSNEGTAAAATTTTHESMAASNGREDEDDMDDLLPSPTLCRTTQQQQQQQAAACSSYSLLSPQPGEFFSMPTTFTIISCYMWLFRGYEAVFAAIDNALLAQQFLQDDACQEQQQGHGTGQNSSSNTPSSRTGNAVAREAIITANNKKKKTRVSGPSILPDINIGGFGLDCHPHLQIEMLIHVSCQMLQRIEGVLGVGPSGGGEWRRRRRGGRCSAHSAGPSPAREATTVTTTVAMATSAMAQDGGGLDLGGAPALLASFLHGAGGGDGEGPSSARFSLVRGVVRSIRHKLGGGGGGGAGGGGI
ncbi:Cytochalasin cluster regulator ccsR [Colletotrichum orbiculare MAFF 240422]|uniref:Cytochalasin cluster regulator ccsR n=1 Tax=Colletotrichum orbiculare (strain 104-T / ATCC 96160 / CBS 514.97 / LARS 414 / MAFF 240422) TaxID=1213857 RepID=N4VYT5_COLOR|nr:Cytochalasin cluster regulator ccsR [Colletotrichum orbiculare MAFF 240422]